MKKTGIVLGALLLAAGLVGCGEKKEAAAPAENAVRMGLTAYKFDDNFIAYLDKLSKRKQMQWEIK